MGVQNYRDLEIWQEAMDVAAEAYELTKLLPTSERFGLASQIWRAAGSVAAQIAEGHPKGTKEFLYKLQSALGELMEVETHIQLAARVGLLQAELVDAMLARTQRLAKRINATRAALQRKMTAEEAQKGRGRARGGAEQEEHW